MIKCSISAMTKITVSISLASLFFLTLDHFFALKADERVLMQDAYFMERISEIHLNPSGPRVQACHVGYELFIYAYQTCFVIPWDIPLRKSNEATDKIRFEFIYHKPQPWIKIFHFSSQYYFSAIELGEKLKTINAADLAQINN